MANYSGPPPFGAQYGSALYGQPFHPNSLPPFNPMIPPPPSTNQHGQQQPLFPFNHASPPQNTQQSPFPFHRPPPVAGSYGNTPVYPPFPPPQHGQIPYPPVPPPGFYNNPYAAYNNHVAYVNGYHQNANVQNNGSQPIQMQELGSQQHSDNSQQPSEDHELEQGNSKEIQGQFEASAPDLRDLTKLQTSTNLEVGQPQNVTDSTKDATDAVGVSSGSASEQQTPMQLDSATTVNSRSDEDTERNPEVLSPTESEASSDPYASVPFHSVVGANDRANSMSPAPVKAPAAVLPGLDFGADTKVPKQDTQSKIETERQQKKALAIQAIQDLASRHIGYDLISQEEIDPQVLKNLYLESGVPLVLSQRAAPTNQPALVLKNETTATTATSYSRSTKPKNSSIDPPTITAVPDFNIPFQAFQIQAAAQNVSSHATEPPSKTNTPPAKARNELPAPNANATRQDYLAKLQAAKQAVQVKPVPSRTTSQRSDRLSYLAKLQAAKQAMDSKESSSNVTSTPPSNGPVQSAILQSNTRADLNASLRQKLEALRKTQITKSQENPVVDALVGKDEAQQEPRPASSGQLSATPKREKPTRTFSVDQAKKTDVGFFGRSLSGDLPGLFDLPGLSSATLGSVQSAVDVSQAILSPKSHENDKGNGKDVNVQSIPHQNIVNFEAPFSSQSSRKRPAAIDYLDDASKKAPRVDYSLRQPFDTRAIEPRLPVPALRDSPGYAGTTTYLTQSHHNDQVPQPIIPDLQAKEDEIRALKERIQAVESRKIGKQADSNSSVDGFSEQAKHIDQQSTIIQEATKELTVQEKALAAAKLQVQRALEEKRRNQASLNVHANKAQIEANNATSLGERERNLQRRTEVEAKIRTIETTIATSMEDLEALKRQEEQLSARIKANNEVRSTFQEELKGLLQALAAETEQKKATPDQVVLLQVPNEDEAVIVPHEISVSPVQDATPITEDAVMADRDEGIPFEAVSATAFPGISNSAAGSIEILSSESEGVSRTSSPFHDAVKENRTDSENGDEGELQMELDEDSEDEGNEEYDSETVTQIQHDAPVTTDEGLTRGSSHNNDADDDIGDYEPSYEIQPLPIATEAQRDIQFKAETVIEEPETQYATNYQPEETIHSSSSSDRESVSSDASSQVAFIPDSESQGDDIMSNGEKSENSSSADGSEVQDYREDSSGADLQREIEAALQNTSDSDDSTASRSSSAIQPELTEQVQQQQPFTILDIGNDTADGRPTDDATTSAAATEAKKHFVPYESALNQFTSYRFHPSYENAASSGFHSLTYNHKIDPRIELCKWELAGEVCNDPECDYQHFKDVTPTDDDLLQQLLGTGYERASQVEQDAYAAGLRNVLNDMRARGIQDAATIASEIAAFRRSFEARPVGA